MSYFFWKNFTTCRIFLGKFYIVFHFTRDEKIKKTDLEGVLFLKDKFLPILFRKNDKFCTCDTVLKRQILKQKFLLLV